jgi:hypothetical protein
MTGEAATVKIAEPFNSIHPSFSDELLVEKFWVIANWCHSSLLYIPVIAKQKNEIWCLASHEIKKH